MKLSLPPRVFCLLLLTTIVAASAGTPACSADRTASNSDVVADSGAAGTYPDKDASVELGRATQSDSMTRLETTDVARAEIRLEDSCDGCLNEVCEVEMNACLQTPDCLSLLECLEECGVPGACEQKCAAEHPEWQSSSQTAFEAFWCKSNNCQDLCARP